MKDKKTYEIGPMFCGENGFITMRSLSSLMLDISTIQANRVEKNLKAMEDKVWLLYSWDIEILKPIKRGDRVDITTIPTHMKRFYAYRDFLVEKDGELLARAKAIFVLFDRVKMRAAIIDKSVGLAYGESPQNLEQRAYKKKKDLADDVEIYIRKADFDENKHVNNGIYFDYLKEIPDFDEGKIAYIKMIYKNQIKDIDRVKLFYRKEACEVDFKIKSDNDHAYGMVAYV